MDSIDDLSKDFSYGSRLLSQSTLTASGTYLSGVAHGDDDLSISELSLADRRALMEKPFSLLAHPESDTVTPAHRKHRDPQDNEGLYDGKEEGDDKELTQSKTRQASKARENKLQSDIFILKKLNASLTSFNEALDATGSANDRVAEQLEITDRLLNKYVAIMSRSEEIAKLIFDKRWYGADNDAEILERERCDKEERAAREKEEQAFAEKQELERLEQEERDRQKKEQEDRLEREGSLQKPAKRGMRAVRGTRASMRGARGVSSSREGVSSTSVTNTGILPRLPSTAGVRGATFGGHRGLTKRA